MSSFSFIHAADIHLDSPLLGLERYEGAPVEKIRNATREAFKNLIETAIDRKVDFVIIAGDLYDGDWKDFNTGLYFVNQMVRLQKENIRVFLIRGNHDAENMITKELRLPDNVSELSTKAPEKIVIDEIRVTINGQGFATKAVVENLAKEYPERQEGYFNIGIIHTSATGREGHENYAPCSIDDLKEKDYDYWALGHIHMREILQERDPVIIFPGNIQGRHIKETGDKGCTLVEVKNGAIESLTHLPLDVLRWQICEINAYGMETLEELFEATRMDLLEKYHKAEGRFLAIRFVIIGTTKIHQDLLVQREQVINNIRSLSFEIGYDEIWVEKVKIKTNSMLNIDEITLGNTPVAMILNYLQRATNDEEILEELLHEFEDIQKALPYELRTREVGFDFSNIEVIKRHTKNVQDMITYYLTEIEVESK